jgi:hypothetical protein
LLLLKVLLLLLEAVVSFSPFPTQHFSSAVAVAVVVPSLSLSPLPQRRVHLRHVAAHDSAPFQRAGSRQ